MYNFGFVLTTHAQNHLYDLVNLHSLSKNKKRRKQIYQNDSVRVCQDFELNKHSPCSKINTD